LNDPGARSGQRWRLIERPHRPPGRRKLSAGGRCAAANLRVAQSRSASGSRFSTREVGVELFDKELGLVRAGGSFAAGCNERPYELDGGKPVVLDV
jgi:hypothetical protein